MKKRVLTHILCLACLLLPLLTGLSGCIQTVPDPVAEFISYLRDQQYPRIYKLLTRTSVTSLTMADMVDRYEDIAEGLGILSIDGEILSRKQDENGEWDVFILLRYDIQHVGVVELGNTLHLSMQDDTWAIDWNDGMFFPGLEEGDRVSLITLAAERGEIFDVNGNILAQNTPAVSVYADLDKITDVDTTIRLLAPLLSMTEEEVRRKIAPDTIIDTDATPEPTPDVSATPTATPTATPSVTPAATPSTQSAATSRLRVVKAYAPEEFDRSLEEQLTQIPGIGIEEQSFTIIRTYPYGRLLSHQLGYVGYVSAEDLEKEENATLTTDALIGKTGLEREYEMTLRGETGYELAIFDANNAKKTVLWRKDAVDGADLRLTIDVELQQSAELLLMEKLDSNMSGAVIVLDPTTGAILTQASAPSFDVNIFTMGISEETWAQLQDPENRLPLYDRTTLGLYPPGSTFKPFMAGIGLETGAITTTFAFDQSQIEGNTWQPDDERWSYPPIRRVSSTPDPMNLLNAMVYSDNIYFAYTAMQVGEESFREYCTKFGLGVPFDSDLPVASSRISNDESFSSIKVLADSGYGQGEMLISPLQMAALFGSLANEGDVMRPYMVASTARMEGHTYTTVEEFSPTVAIEQVLTEETVATLQPMLRKVITNGTGRDLDIAGLEVCGKTGTAQVGTANEREIAWFIAYNTEGAVPRLVCVALEVPANQGGARAEIAKELMIQATTVAEESEQ